MLSFDLSGARDLGQMDEERGLPAQGLVQLQVAGNARQPLLAAKDVGDAHRPVVHDAGEVVGGEAVGLEEHEVVHQAILERHAAANQVVEDSRAFEGHGEPHHRGSRIVRALLAAAAPVVAATVLADCFEPRRGAGAPVGRAALDQHAGGAVVVVETLGLVVWRVGTADVGALVPLDAQPPQRLEHLVDGALDEASLVGVLDPDDEGAAAPAGEEPVVDRRAHHADVRAARGTRGEPYANVVIHAVDSLQASILARGHAMAGHSGATGNCSVLMRWMCRLRFARGTTCKGDSASRPYLNAAHCVGSSGVWMGDGSCEQVSGYRAGMTDGMSRGMLVGRWAGGTPVSACWPVRGWSKARRWAWRKWRSSPGAGWP